MRQHYHDVYLNKAPYPKPTHNNGAAKHYSHANKHFHFKQHYRGLLALRLHGAEASYIIGDFPF